MQVFVTGATGFVGGALVRALAAGGAQIRALYRTSSSRERLGELPIEWVQGDLTEPASLCGTLDGVDWVIHAAGMLGQAGVPESAYQELHIAGTRHVLAEVTAAGGPAVLYISSPGVLGPIAEGSADERAPLAPSNPYERSKAAAEQLALNYPSAVVVRPEFIYGPGDTHVLGLFRAVQNGTFFYVGLGRHTCHPTFLSDAVKGMLLCMKKGRPGEIYHITGPRAVTFREFGETIAAALGVRPPWLMIPKPIAWLGAAGLELAGRVTSRHPPLSRSGVAFFSESRRFSWQKASEELSYVPQVELPDGVTKTVAWYREQGYL